MPLISNIDHTTRIMVAALERNKPVMVKKMGAIALHFINENFDKEEFQGGNDGPWDKRKSKKTNTHKILQGKSGNLKRSPFISYEDSERSRITSNLAYSRIHNEGGQIRHPYRQVSLFFTGKPGALKLAKNKTQTQQRKITEVRHSSVYNHFANMPKRQYMGSSPVLTDRIKTMIRTETILTFKIIR